MHALDTTHVIPEKLDIQEKGRERESHRQACCFSRCEAAPREVFVCCPSL
jgi:hypothetical protein